MSKKVIGALLALVMALSVFSLTVFAVGQISDESTTDAAKYTQTWSLSTPELDSGSTYKVKVYLKTNYPVGPVQFKLNNVSGATVTRGSGYYTQSEVKCSPSGLVILTPSTSAPLVGETFETAREIAVITYTKGSADPVIDNSPKTIANPTGTLYAARLSGSTAVNSANLVLGQTVSIDGQTPTPPAGNVTLTGKNGGVVDTARGYVYGVPVGTADPTTYFTTTGYMEMVKANIDGAKINGTGATLNLYSDSSKATLVKSYTLIIFGDVDGNGAVDVNDSMAVDKHVAATLLLTGEVFRFAADVDPNDAVDVNDSLALDKHVASTLLLKSNVRAA